MLPVKKSAINLLPFFFTFLCCRVTITELFAKYMTRSKSRSCSADEAADWGLVWKAVDDDALAAEGDAVLQKLAKGPTRGLGLIRNAVQNAFTHSLDTQLDWEREYQRDAGSTADFAEGVSAFLEKRPADFKGR